MAFWDLSDSQRMGAGLLGFAFFFILLGFALFFDRALLALGNIFLIVGVILLLVSEYYVKIKIILFVFFSFYIGN
jgi:hypothetical protein